MSSTLINASILTTLLNNAVLMVLLQLLFGFQRSVSLGSLYHFWIAGYGFVCWNNSSIWRASSLLINNVDKHSSWQSLIMDSWWIDPQSSLLNSSVWSFLQAKSFQKLVKLYIQIWSFQPTKFENPSNCLKLIFQAYQVKNKVRTYFNIGVACKKFVSWRFC